MLKKTELDIYRRAYTQLVGEYNRVASNRLPVVCMSLTPPEKADQLKERVRNLAHELSYTDSEMSDLGISWCG